MSTDYIFNYDEFYTYYTNPNNIITNTSNCVEMHYYNSNKLKLPTKGQPKCDYIMINGQTIYITNANKSNVYKDTAGNKVVEKTYDLLFSIPTKVNGILFDFHYHFGKKTFTNYVPISDKQYINSANQPKHKTYSKSKTKKYVKTGGSEELEIVSPTVNNLHINPNEKLVYFHKTIQQVNLHDSMGVSKHINCYFQDNTQIRNINNIVCIDEDKTVMGKLLFEQDIILLSQIISKPFISLSDNMRKRGGLKKVKKNITRKR